MLFRSHGQIDVFVQAESAYNFYYVTKWVIGGEDNSLSAANLARLLVLKTDPDARAAAFAWPPPAAVRLTAPTTLMLKNISGTPRRRFAMINGTTLAVNESAKIPLGTTNVTVRCLEIKGASVIIQVAGESAPKELALPVKGDAAAR